MAENNNSQDQDQFGGQGGKVFAEDNDHNNVNIGSSINNSPMGKNLNATAGRDSIF